jgi:hypothetical protein
VLVGFSQNETQRLRAQIPVDLQLKSGFDRDASAVSHDIKKQLLVAYYRVPGAVSLFTIRNC